MKLTPPDEAAVYILMGMETSPKEIVPDPSECGAIAGPSQLVKFYETWHGSTAGAMLQDSGRSRTPVVVTVAGRGEGL